MTKVKIELEAVRKDGFFSGYFYRDELPLEMRTPFRSEIVEVEGEFKYDTHGDYPGMGGVRLVGTLSAFEYGPERSTSKLVELGPNVMDYDFIVDQIMDYMEHRMWV